MLGSDLEAKSITVKSGDNIKLSGINLLYFNPLKEGTDGYCLRYPRHLHRSGKYNPENAELTAVKISQQCLKRHTLWEMNPKHFGCSRMR